MLTVDTVLVEWFGTEVVDESDDRFQHFPELRKDLGEEEDSLDQSVGDARAPLAVVRGKRGHRLQL